MYEFIDADGTRVTIRSARTLGLLLANARIKETTRFRLAEEPEFRPAGQHPSLVEIAAQAGVPFGVPAPRATAVPQAGPTPASLQAPAPQIPTPMPRASHAPIAQAPTTDIAPRRGSVPPTAKPTVALAAAAGPVREPLSAPPKHEAERRRGANPLGQAFVVVALLLGAAVLGALAGAVAGGVTKSAVVGWLVTVAGASWLARLAGRRLVQRTPSLSRVEIGAGSAAFIAGCLLAGWPGVIVGLPACAVLWSSLGRQRG